MADNFNTLSNRLLARCPSIGIFLAEQFVNDTWAELQARREWSFRRRFHIFAPPNLYQTGTASTNVAAGSPTLITGSGTAWTRSMAGRQIRIGGLNYPFYTIVGVLSATSLLLDKPWAGPDVAGQSYTILQAYYPVPDDWAYPYAIVSIKDSYRLWTTVTESELAVLDPQRTNYGQTYAAVFRSFTASYSGVIGPVIPVSDPASPSPVSTTTLGYSGVADNTFIIQVVAGGASGTATFRWMVAGQAVFQPTIPTSDTEQDLALGLQIYWPTGVTYAANDLFIINCAALSAQGTPLIELWPAPTFDGYLYPAIYIAKEYALSRNRPSLPPFMANRGDVLLELALQKCAEWPGPDFDRPNPYWNLKQAQYHGAKFLDMLVDLERNDDEVAVESISYQSFPMAPAPWMTGQWQQHHAQTLLC